MDIIKGKLWIINEEDVNTDLIFAGKYTYEQLTPEEMGKKALEDFDKDFHNKLSPGDFIVSGKNFGCGSSREQAVTCFKGLKLGGIIAKSFSRLYYRNAINKALLAIDSPELAEYVFADIENLDGKEISVDASKGEIAVNSKIFKFSPLTGQALEIFNAGGLVQYTKERLKNK